MQNQREVTLAGFRSGKFPVLVATDVAARGLDISGVELVVQCEPPKDPETYIHRSGKTRLRLGTWHPQITASSNGCLPACGLKAYCNGYLPAHAIHSHIQSFCIGHVQDNCIPFQFVSCQGPDHSTNKQTAGEKAFCAQCSNQSIVLFA